MPPKKAAANPFGSGKGSKKAKGRKHDAQYENLFETQPKNFHIGGSVQPKRDLTHAMKWPKYVRLQRQKVVLNKRLKVPPAVNQFNHTLDKNTATQLFRFLNKYRPETKQEKQKRIHATAEKAAADREAKDKDAKRPIYVRHGLNHTVGLVESKKANLVVIANDVDPIELVIYLPALCRKMGVPYVIVKNKSRLGTVVHQKTAAVLVVTDVKKEDEKELATLVSAAKANFTDKYDDHRRRWGGGVKSQRSTQKLAKRARLAGTTLAAVQAAQAGAATS
ncbi:hypothetical protein M407DRAFT_112297 [Tulasnella calospora MUT 4182]|uniref:60S ribosomal protein L8 n=1 Tax=Tulasnella calospora MUT 4182 TaxID=1051891 RepID=A0A0C3MEW7_9AGAM|nr:hypothetical protein M407DRAFT_112297 [Tulasnella calospora MUT 4182]